MTVMFSTWEMALDLQLKKWQKPVSYTHLDVYKRQVVAVGSIAEEGTAVLEIANPELWNTENI